jgi:hypothetical protein
LPAEEISPTAEFLSAGKQCHTTGAIPACLLDLDSEGVELPPAGRRAQAFTLHMRSADVHGQRERAAALVQRVVEESPYTSLDVLLEPVGGPARLTEQALAAILAACFTSTSYLDLYYSLHPNRLLGAKRLVVILSSEDRAVLGPARLDRLAQYATIGGV